MRGNERGRHCANAAKVLALLVLGVLVPNRSSEGTDDDPFAEARQLLDAKRFDDVVAAVGRVLTAHPNDADLHVVGSELLRDALRPRNAAAVAERAVTLRPEDPAVRLQLARSTLDAAQNLRDPSERQKALSAAADLFGEAASLAPADPQVLVEWAEVLVRAERHEDALSVWNRVLGIDRHRLSAHLGAVRALADLDRWDDLRAVGSGVATLPRELGWQVALVAYDEAAIAKRYEIADSFLPSLRALAEGTVADFAVKALDAVANRPYDQALGWLAKYLAAAPDSEEAEVVSNAVIERGLGEIPRPKRLPNRRRESTAAGEIALPQLAQKVEPFYPTDLEARGVEGHVVIQAVVRTDGTIGRMKVFTSDHPHFTVAALDAIKRWQYLPALLDGKPVAIYYTIRIDFRLKQRPKPPRKKK